MPDKTSIHLRWKKPRSRSLVLLSPFFALLTLNGAASCAAPSAANQDSEIAAKLKEARMLAIDKKYQPALNDYLWVFEHSRQQPKWQGLRNAQVSAELVKLAESYEPGKAEVLKLRDDREKLLLADKAERADVQDWCLLNHNLKDDRHSVAIYKQLTVQGDATERVCDWIEECIPVVLVHAKEYKELLPWAEKAAAEHIATVEKSEKNGEYGRLALPLVMEDVYACYEVLLADGKEEEASKLVNTMLRPWASHDMFSAFVHAAKRTGHTKEADELLAFARKKVSATDYELILGEIK